MKESPICRIFSLTHSNEGKRSDNNNEYKIIK